MAVRAALVDRCFIQRKQAATKVRGREVYLPAEGAEIRCRLTMNRAGERLEDGRVLTEPTPTVWIFHRDETGKEVRPVASDKLRIVSAELGTALWQVDGDPTPARKRRRILGWEATVKRLDEQPQPQEAP